MEKYAFEAFRDRVKESLRLEDVVAAAGVELKRCGSQLRGRSPFNDDRTPSFYVHPGKQLWHDYSGGGAGGGDVFEFIKRHRGCTFYEALLDGAERAGIERPDADDPAVRAALDRHHRLRELRRLLTAAATYYHQRLPAEIRETYFHTQYGFTDETIAEQQLGWADGTLRSHFIGDLKLDRVQCLATGLFAEVDGNLVDFFHNRLVFPYWKDGAVANFAARQTHLTRKVPWEEAKYKRLPKPANHPHVSPLLDDVPLYCEDHAWRAATLVITEGQPDCVSAIQAGFDAIAPGTNKFSDDDLPRLIELTERVKKIVLCNDNEQSRAGDQGAQLTAAALWKAGRPVFVATLPRPADQKKVDVNDLVRVQGAEALRKVVDEARWWPDYLIAEVPQDARGPALTSAIAPVLAAAAVASAVDQDQILTALAKRSGVSKRILQGQLRGATKPERGGAAERGGVPEPRSNGEDRPLIHARPGILITGKQRNQLIWEMGQLLVTENQRICARASAERTQPGPIFRRRRGLSMMAWTDDGTVHLEELDDVALYGAFARYADWFKREDPDEPPRAAAPPGDIIRDAIKFPSFDIPRVDAIATTPVIGQSGTLLMENGLHMNDRLWMHCNLRMPLIPECPTPDDIARARALLLEDLLVDFPFASPSDRAHAVATMLLPFVRPLIEGCTPLHLFDASGQGSGKTLLASLIGVITTGADVAGKTLPDNEDEVRKRITSELMEGKPFILLDNADDKKAVDSPSLAGVLTMKMWGDRVLGVNKTVELENRAVWCMTGNNVRLSRDLLRRVIRIRLDPDVDPAWLRTGFKHDPISVWVPANRPALVHALLTLCQAWIAQGRPPGSKRLGSFEEWAFVMGGILKVAQISGFLENLGDLYQGRDEDAGDWDEFVGAWAKRFGEQAVRVKQLNALCDEMDLLDRGDKGGRSQLIRLGFLLKAKVGRQFRGYKISRQGVVDHQQVYGLAPVEAPSVDPWR